VNDQLGHDAGDDVLIQIARRMSGVGRACDTVARTGGDEFVVLCAGLRETEDAATIAAKIRDAVEAPFLLDGKNESVPLHPGETLLDSGRRAGLAPPFSCEAGNCGTCMAMLREGTATMKVNDALDDDEVDEGYVLTCQAIPDGSVVVDYDC